MIEGGVLITGGSGSFGQAYVKDLIANHKPKRIVVFSRGEHAQEQMAREISHPNLRFFIGDVRDQSRLEMAMRDIDVVVHAAALKIVPTAEYNPTEAVATNVMGAQNLVRAALRTRVRQVVALSTDKACNPINLYGATKLTAEKIFMAANNLSGADGCRFSAVRYGNVFGSRGSVVPFFQSLKAQGRPLQVTDWRMTRFCITMPQAIELVNFAIQDNSRGSIYIPKLPSIDMHALTKAIDPDGVPLEIGIRPGEKLHETLLTEDEARSAISLGARFIINAKEFCGIYGVDPPPEPLPDDFGSYNSYDNTSWLTAEQIRGLIDGYNRQNRGNPTPEQSSMDEAVAAGGRG